MAIEPRGSRARRFGAVVITAVFLATALGISSGVAPAPVRADNCPSGQICTVTIDGTTYVVIGPCDTSTLGSSISGCLIISTTGGGDPLLICGLYGCGPDVISQTTLGSSSLEQEAEGEIASLRGVPNDRLNVFWSRGEVRAYMYLRLLTIANAAAGTLSEQDQHTADFFKERVHESRVTVAQAAVDLYNAWANDPCGFQVPVGDPNAYLDQEDVAKGITAPCNIPPNSPACLLGSCDPAPPSAEQFTAWAEGQTLEAEIGTWGKGLQQEGGISLTDEQAKAAAAFEYDATFGGVAEGIGYLTAKHAAVADVPDATESEAESDLQERWIEALGDFAGEQFRDLVKTAVVKVFMAFDNAVAEGFASELEEGLAVALEEDAAGLLAESWETVIGPVIAAAAIIAYETWLQVVNADVPIKLHAALTDAQQDYSLAHYAADTDGRSLLLEALVKSTLPDFLATRLGDGTYGSAPDAGPAKPSDPFFISSSADHPGTDAAASFITQDWDGDHASTSVRDGWFVQKRGDGPHHYTPVLDYVSGGGTSTCNGSGCTVSPGISEHWRAWLDGSQFLAQRVKVDAGDGYVTDAINSCGADSFLLPSGNVDLGYLCVFPNGATFPFPIKHGDVVEMGGQVRTVAGVNKDSSGNVTSFSTETPFGQPVPAFVPVMVLTQLDGTCMDESSLGDRVAGPDCTLGPTIHTELGASVTLWSRPTLTITASSATADYNDPVPTITPSYSGFVGSDTVASLATAPNCSTTYTQGSGPGNYATSCDGAVDSKYIIKYVGGTVNVPASPMTITASSATVAYGDAVPTITPSYAGDPPAWLTTKPTCTTTYTQGSPPGTYPTSCSGAVPIASAIYCTGTINGPISCSGGGPAFEIHYAAGSLTVTTAPLTVTASSPGITYGDPVPTISASYSGFKNGDTPASLTASPTCGTTYADGSSVGDYPTSCAGAVDANYTIGYVAGSVSVSTAPLTVVADDKSMIQGGTLPSLSGTLSGVVNGDHITASYSTTGTSSSPAGSYPVTPALADPDHKLPDYAVTITPGTLRILYQPAGTLCLGAPGHAVLPRIDSDGSSVFKQNSTVAVKFRVCDAGGHSIGTPGVALDLVLVKTISGASVQHLHKKVAGASGSTAFRWDATNQQWIYNLDTKDLSAGTTYVYRIDLNDGTAITFQFGLR